LELSVDSKRRSAQSFYVSKRGQRSQGSRFQDHRLYKRRIVIRESGLHARTSARFSAAARRKRANVRERTKREKGRARADVEDAGERRTRSDVPVSLPTVALCRRRLANRRATPSAVCDVTDRTFQRAL